MNFCECGGEVDIRYGGHGAKFYAECRECGKTVDLKAVDRLGAIQEWNNRNEEKTMNLIPKIAEMLGVEIGEEFDLCNGMDSNIRMGCIYKFSNDCLLCADEDDKDCFGVAFDKTLRCMLNGSLKIIKLPFEPKLGEQYWSVCWNEHELGSTVIMRCDYSGYFSDKYCGNVFRNQAEAEAHKFEIYEKLTGKEWGK